MHFKQIILALTLIGIGLICHAEKIEYEIFSIGESGKPTQIAKGVKVYTDADFLVEQRSLQGETHWSKELPLVEGFRIGASIYREPIVSGFGLWAKFSPCSFSWEWFEASGGDRFKKIQEGGSLSVTYLELGPVQEISKIVFRSDASLRINDSQDVAQVTHRVLIKAGSVLKFPPSVPVQRARPDAMAVACAR